MADLLHSERSCTRNLPQQRIKDELSHLQGFHVNLLQGYIDRPMIVVICLIEFGFFEFSLVHVKGKVIQEVGEIFNGYHPKKINRKEDMYYNQIRIADAVNAGITRCSCSR